MHFVLFKHRALLNQEVKVWAPKWMKLRLKTKFDSTEFKLNLVNSIQLL